MKKLLLISFLLTAIISADAQIQTVFRRVTSRVETIPAADTLTGTIRIDSAYSSTYRFLRYIGTTNLANVFQSGAVGNKTGWMWLYIPSDSILAKVVSVAAIGDATLDTFRIEVVSAITMTGSKAFLSIKAKDYGYSFQNDGSANGYANGVVIKTNEAVTMTLQAIQGTSQTNWQEPVIINAQATDFLIVERKGQ